MRSNGGACNGSVLAEKNGLSALNGGEVVGTARRGAEIRAGGGARRQRREANYRKLMHKMKLRRPLPRLSCPLIRHRARTDESSDPMQATVRVKMDRTRRGVSRRALWPQFRFSSMADLALMRSSR